MDLEALLRAGAYQQVRAEGSRQLEAGDLPAAERAVALRTVARACLGMQDYYAAAKYGEQAVELAREVGDTLTAGKALFDLGCAYLYTGEAHGARRHLEEFLGLLPSVPELQGWEGLAHYNLSHVCRQLKHWPEAVAALERAAGVFEQRTERAALARDDYYSTRTCMERALAAGATGEILGQVRLVLGDAQQRTGDLSAAVATLEAFLAGMWEYPALGPLWQSAGLYNLGLTYRQLGRLDEARAAYEAAADGFRRESLWEQLGMTLWNLAWVLCLQGDTAAAREALAESERVRVDEWARWHQLVGWAFVEAAEGWQHSTTEMCKRIIGADAPPDVQAHAHWLLGREALRQGDPRMAMTMAEAAINAANSDPGSNRARNDAADLWRAAKLQLHELDSEAAGA